MNRYLLIALLLCCGLVASASAAAPKAKGAPLAPDTAAADFPPGVFTDNGNYKFDDFQGKLLILFFYEQQCPTCRASIPKRNEMVREFKDKPVKFIAVAAGDSLVDARAYAADTKLAMPIFADPLSLMERAYCTPQISLNNIYQLRAIMPDGSVRTTAYDGSGVAKLVADLHWKYKKSDYDPKLHPAIDLLEWNQWEAGLKALRPYRKDRNKDLAASAEKLYADVKAELSQWKTDADTAMDADPVKAFDLYTRLKACFVDDDLAKSAEESLKKLRVNKAVVDELAARKQLTRLQEALAAARPEQKAEVAAFCKQLAAQFPQTPSGKKAQALADQLGS